MREHSTPEKECLQRIADIAIGYDGNADANCEQGSMKGLCGLIDEMKELAGKGLRGEWPEPETFWMIERNIDGVPHWWVREPGQYSAWYSPERWTTDATKAKHYSSKYDALHVIGDANAPEAYREQNMIGCIATEHTFIEKS